MRAHPDIDIDVDLSFLSEESKTLALEFLELSKPKRKSLRERFPRTNEALIDILEEMLEINPAVRPTANQLLQNKIFDKVRMAKNEITSPFKIAVNFDKGLYAFDYEKQTMNPELGKKSKII